MYLDWLNVQFNLFIFCTKRYIFVLMCTTVLNNLDISIRYTDVYYDKILLGILVITESSFSQSLFFNINICRIFFIQILSLAWSLLSGSHKIQPKLFSPAWESSLRHPALKPSLIPTHWAIHARCWYIVGTICTSY